MQPQNEQNFWQPQQPAAPEPVAPAEQPSVNTASDTPLQWQASEYIHHEKHGQWFLALFGVAALLIVIAFFLIQSLTFGILIAVMTLSVAVIARRPPRVMTYLLSPHGIRVNDRTFNLFEFRAFGLVQEQAMYSIRLIPNKRFMPMVSVYFPPELGEQIVDMLGANLPMETIHFDALDRLVEKIRF